MGCILVESMNWALGDHAAVTQTKKEQSFSEKEGILQRLRVMARRKQAGYLKQVCMCSCS